MAPGSFRFGDFVLDPRDRQLRRAGAPVELNARYLDALTLLVGEQGRLVTKDRFLDEVWRGVPVTEEALTQCVRTLRRQLGDDAARPRFIETVPKHGYRFIAPVETAGEADAAARTDAPATGDARKGPDLRGFFATGAAGSAGGGVAGMLGGMFYSLAGTSQDGALQAGGPGGGASALLVLVCLTMVLGLAAGAAVGFGIAAAGFAPRRRAMLTVLGGAGGGLIVGAAVKLLGVDAFNLLFGRSPGDITGGVEGALLGAAVGLGAWLACDGGRGWSLRRAMAVAGLTGGAAGIAIHLLGGRLMAGSLDLVARQFPESRLRLDRIGVLFGEDGFGPVSQVAVTALEGALFAACVAGAMMLARRRLRP